MNHKNESATLEFKQCAGKNCTNIAKYLLNIVLIRKSGWFCSKCKKSLQEDNLIESIDNKTDDKR